jgi:threonine/homoserine/homoserine lactone efflux protein
MALQIAIGPVCLFILNAASINGFRNAECGVIGVSIIDSLYIGLALIGLGRLIKGEAIQKYLRYFGSAILFLFGITMFIGAITHSNFMAIHSNITANGINTFTAATILTAANPLTIVFWTGVFSLKVSQQNNGFMTIVFFALGCILSTFVFLSIVAFSGSMINLILPNNLMKFLNGLVGLALIAYAVKWLFQTHKTENSGCGQNKSFPANL